MTAPNTPQNLAAMLPMPGTFPSPHRPTRPLDDESAYLAQQLAAALKRRILEDLRDLQSGQVRSMAADVQRTRHWMADLRQLSRNGFYVADIDTLAVPGTLLTPGQLMVAQSINHQQYALFLESLVNQGWLARGNPYPSENDPVIQIVSPTMPTPRVTFQTPDETVPLQDTPGASTSTSAPVTPATPTPAERARGATQVPLATIEEEQETHTPTSDNGEEVLANLHTFGENCNPFEEFEAEERVYQDAACPTQHTTDSEDQLRRDHQEADEMLADTITEAAEYLRGVYRDRSCNVPYTEDPHRARASDDTGATETPATTDTPVAPPRRRPVTPVTDTQREERPVPEAPRVRPQHMVDMLA